MNWSLGNKLTLLLIILSADIYGQSQIALIPYRKGDLFGFVNRKKKMIIKPRFANAYPFGYAHNHTFYPDLALVQIGSEMYLVDKKGKLIKEEIFQAQNEGSEFPPPTRERLMPVYRYKIFEVNGKKGIKNEKDSIVIPPIYDHADLYYLENEYYNERENRHFSPAYIAASNDSMRTIIRIDKFKIYEHVSIASCPAHANHIIVSIKKGNAYQYGILTEDTLTEIDPKYIRANKFYEDQNLLSVDKVINRHPVSIYIDLKGNEYFEE